MRMIAVLAVLGMMIGGVFASPIPSKVPNASYVKKVRTCQTNCYTLGNQQHCTTTCF